MILNLHRQMFAVWRA